jgi:diacylglycerol O-acyltransferase / wax synthase
MSHRKVGAVDEIDRASASDLVTLATDRGQVPMNLGAVLIIDKGSELDLRDVRLTVAQRLPCVPRLRRRLLRAPFGCGRSVWVDDVEFDLDRHLSAVALPRPTSSEDGRVETDDETLLQVASGLVCTPLEHDRPLWAALWVTGLTEGRAALVLVMHHVLTDGVGGIAVLDALADGHVRAGVDTYPQPPPTRSSLAGAAWRGRAAGLALAPQTLRLALRGLGELGLGSRPPTLAARTSLNRPTGPERRLTTVDVSLVDVVTSAHRRNCTVNDLVLTAVTGALSAVLRHRGEHPMELVVSVPVSSRRSAIADQLGNQTGVAALSIPTIPDRDARLRRIADMTRNQKAHPRGSSGAPLGVVFRGLARLRIFQPFIDHQRLVHTFVTNVRGPETPVRFAGHEILTLVPVAVTPGNVSVCFDVLSYGGRLLVTVVVDPDLVPEGARLTRLLADELDGLLQEV